MNNRRAFVFIDVTMLMNYITLSINSITIIFLNKIKFALTKFIYPMTFKKKVLNILLLIIIAFVFFKISTFVVYSYAFPPENIDHKNAPAINP